MSLPPVEIPLGAMRFNSDFQKLEYFNGDVWMKVHTFNPDLDGGARGFRAGAQTGGGSPWPQTDRIDYITIATIGHAEPFGDLTVTTMSIDGLSSNTRGLFAAGTTPTMVKTIDYITIASTGDAADFGDLITVNSHYACTSNGIKGIWAGGYDGSGEGYNLIEFVTIATTGNAQDFGDLLNVFANLGGTSDSNGGLSE